MWIMLNDAFLSIVDEKAKTKKRRGNRPYDTDVLVVRARRQGDIERVFGGLVKPLQVEVNDVTDYRFRAKLPRSVVKQAMLTEVDRVTYGNFKGSVGDNRLHSAYNGVWGVMYRLQEKPQTYPSWLDEGVPV